MSSLIFAVVSAVLTAGDLITSVVFEGNAGIFAGAIGLAAFLFAVAAFFIGLFGLGVRNVSHKKAYIGIITGGLVIIFWLAVMIRAVK